MYQSESSRKEAAATPSQSAPIQREQALRSLHTAAPFGTGVGALSGEHGAAQWMALQQTLGNRATMQRVKAQQELGEQEAALIQRATEENMTEADEREAAMQLGQSEQQAIASHTDMPVQRVIAADMIETNKLEAVMQSQPPEREAVASAIAMPVQRVSEALASATVPLLQRMETAAPVASDSASSEAAINRTGMPDTLKSGIESISGMDMSDVRVHYNSHEPNKVNAHAYAQGSDIHLAPGQDQHLPHEAWHVVQQRQGRVQPTMQLESGVAVNDDAGLEKEATDLGELALSEGVKQRKAVLERTDH